MQYLLDRFEAITREPSFGDATLLAFCSAIIAAAALMAPSHEVLTLFGQPIPVMCTFRWLTGHGCPGCGLTRSFVFLAHGYPAEAFRMNPAGPVAFAWVAAQIPWRGYRIWRRSRAIGAPAPRATRSREEHTSAGR